MLVLKCACNWLKAVLKIHAVGLCLILSQQLIICAVYTHAESSKF